LGGRRGDSSTATDLWHEYGDCLEPRPGRRGGDLVSRGESATGARAEPYLPRTADAYLKSTVRLTDQERSALLGGAPVTKLLDSDPATEVAVFGAVWVAASPDLYVKAVNDIENFEKGENFRVTKKISDPPRLEDFAPLELPADDIADLKECRVGSSEIKLSQNALDRVRKAVDWSKPTASADVNALARQIALEYAQAYREGGNARLAEYRDRDRPTFVAKEFESMVNRMPELTEYLPDIRRYLLEYPKYTLPGSTYFLYWQEAKFGLKPTVRVNHVVIIERPEAMAVASKQIYASHYFWTALELRVVVPDPSHGKGFWFVNINRSRSDGLSGFVGRMIRGKVRGEAQSGMEAVLKITKTTLEREAGKR
jgi:hypothetical protein